LNCSWIPWIFLEFYWYVMPVWIVWFVDKKYCRFWLPNKHRKEAFWRSQKEGKTKFYGAPLQTPLSSSWLSTAWTPVPKYTHSICRPPHSKLSRHAPFCVLDTYQNSLKTPWKVLNIFLRTAVATLLISHKDFQLFGNSRKATLLIYELNCIIGHQPQSQGVAWGQCPQLDDFAYP